jgi:glycosyltransferase involved in cell wall biosynthesis
LTQAIDSLNKKIVLISSGQPSLNPRLVKEADSLTDNGYDVTVLYAYWNSWGTEIDKKLLPLKRWKAVCIGGDPDQKPITFFLSRLIHKLSLAVIKRTGNNFLARFAIARSSFFLLREAQKYKAQLYIGHNLGALPAAVQAAKKHNKLCGFDAEDFHRYETSDNPNDKEVALKTYIENKYIPQTNYLSASSPQIAYAYHQLFPGKDPVVLLNVFPKTADFKQVNLNRSGPVKLFWFSQTIGANRGIEDIVNALQLVEAGHFELHLLGDHQPQTISFINELNICKAKIYYNTPIMPDALVEFASQFDIGLALEDKIPYNRDICLTNKIFTYMQAGLGIIASDTTAQKELMSKFPETGNVYKKGEVTMLAQSLEYYFHNRDALHKAKKASFETAHNKLNWEKESEKFLALIENTLAV